MLTIGCSNLFPGAGSATNNEPSQHPRLLHALEANPLVGRQQAPLPLGSAARSKEMEDCVLCVQHSHFSSPKIVAFHDLFASLPSPSSRRVGGGLLDFESKQIGIQNWIQRSLFGFRGREGVRREGSSGLDEAEEGRGRGARSWRRRGSKAGEELGAGGGGGDGSTRREGSEESTGRGEQGELRRARRAEEGVELAAGGGRSLRGKREGSREEGWS
eukprot:3889665-Rhodomonas_salina.1